MSSTSPQSELNKIALIGAISGFENDPDSKDYKFVMPVLEYLERSGLCDRSKVQSDAINFFDGRNFLDENKGYDAVFICHIPNGRNLSWTRLTFNQYSQGQAVDNVEQLANTIDAKNSPDRWMDRIHASGAKLIAAIGTYIEVDVNYLAQASAFKNYRSLIAPKNDAGLIGRGNLFERNAINPIYGEDIDIPFQWLSIAAEKKYINRIASVLRPNTTDLVHRMVEQASVNPKKIAKPQRLQR